MTSNKHVEIMATEARSSADWDMVTRVPSVSIDQQTQIALGRIVAQTVRDAGIKNAFFHVEYTSDRSRMKIVSLNDRVTVYDLAAALERKGILYDEPSEGVSFLMVSLSLPMNLLENNEALKGLFSMPLVRPGVDELQEVVDGYRTGVVIPVWHKLDLPHIRIIEERLKKAVTGMSDVIVMRIPSPNDEEFGLAFSLQSLDRDLQLESVMRTLKEQGLNLELYTPDPQQPSRRFVVYRWPESMLPVVRAKLESSDPGKGRVVPLFASDESTQVQWIDVLFRVLEDEGVGAEDTVDITTEELQMQDRLKAMARTLRVELDELVPDKDEYYASYELRANKEKVDLFLRLCEDTDIDFDQEEGPDVIISLRRQPRNAFGLLLPEIVTLLRQHVMIIPKAHTYSAFRRGGHLQLVFDPMTNDEVSQHLLQAMSLASLDAE
jgi:hypothetical protein